MEKGPVVLCACAWDPIYMYIHRCQYSSDLTFHIDYASSAKVQQTVKKYTNLLFWEILLLSLEDAVAGLLANIIPPIYLASTCMHAY
jgi:hypothetical protein